MQMLHFWGIVLAVLLDSKCIIRDYQKQNRQEFLISCFFVDRIKELPSLGMVMELAHVKWKKEVSIFVHGKIDILLFPMGKRFGAFLLPQMRLCLFLLFIFLFLLQKIMLLVILAFTREQHM